MKISNSVLRAFNQGREWTFNDSYNEANGLPTAKQSRFLSDVRYQNFGMFKQPITQTHIRKYIESVPKSERYWERLQAVEAESRV